MKPTPYTTDTSKEAEQIQLELIRKMSPTERVNKAISLSTEMARMCKAAIRRRHPDFDETEVGLKFIELNYGKELSAKVRAWQLVRAS